MVKIQPAGTGVSRRSLIRGTAGLVAAAAVAPALASCTSDAPASADTTAASTAGPPAASTSATSTAGGASAALFAELDAKIEAGMQAYEIPGVAVGVWYQGEAYLKGYGVTSLDSPQPVTVDTIFRIGSTTKTFTGTAAMRLVEAGTLDLDATVRTYLPDLTTSDPSVAEVVTVRQLLNHTPGWLGDDIEDFGRGDDAIAEYVASVADLPIITPPGSTFFYNNTALVVAGRVIEAITGTTYEQAVRDLVLDPLQLSRTRFFTDEVVGFPIAASHGIVDDRAQLDTGFWYLPRSLDPTGALLSTVRDQLQYARFHLGHVQGADGEAVLSPASLAAMRSDPGPGGTLLVELDGMGVSWQLRPSAEGVRIVQHGGDWPGQHSGFLFVPDRDFALTMLTNSDGGPGSSATCSSTTGRCAPSPGCTTCRRRRRSARPSSSPHTRASTPASTSRPTAR